MVGHQHIAVNGYAEASGALLEVAAEQEKIPVASEYPLAIVAAVHDMDGKVRKEVSGNSSHIPGNALAIAR